MCGIGGIILKGAKAAPASFDKSLKSICDSLAPRGPDGNGIYTHHTDDHAIGLVHTRLSIIDLDSGAQPMTDDAGRTIVFNGEIYNFIEIRKKLASSYDFKTDSDTETILALYDQYGPKCVEHLRGMYSFAIHDPAKNRLTIARDPFGIKPLYITENDQQITFASEIKAIRAATKNNEEPSLDYLRSLLKTQHGTAETTPFPSITRIPPGATLVFESGEHISTSFRSFLAPKTPRKQNQNDAIDALDHTLKTSTEIHCRSDVGYGLFLSGGVDSNSLLYCLSQMKDQPKLHTYTAWFDVPEAKDEREISRATAAKCGTEHHEIIFSENDFFTLLPQIAAYMSDPMPDYAILPTWKLAAHAAKDQKVILSGEGGDELFAGYGRYRPHWWKKSKLERPITPWSKDQHSPGQISNNWTKLQQRQAKDIAHWLPNDLLLKLDQCLMAHGLEGRTPFLDKKVAELAFTLPDELKIKGKTGKFILKKWLEEKLPESQPFRKKQGFTVPVGSWIANHADTLWPLLEQQEFIKNLLTDEEIKTYQNVISNPQTAHKVWPLLYIALWHKINILGANSNNNVFKVLEKNV